MEQQRGTSAARGYDGQHRRWRAQVLERDQYCVDPDRRHPDRVELATVGDHIVPLEAWERDAARAAAQLVEILGRRGVVVRALDPWSLDNGQGLCLACHNAKSARELNARRRS